MPLTFPKFTMSCDILLNIDLRIQLDPLTEEDWETPNTICEGTTINDQDLDNFWTRLDMVNEILKRKSHGACTEENEIG